jgi:hypothetical protein
MFEICITFNEIFMLADSLIFGCVQKGQFLVMQFCLMMNHCEIFALCPSSYANSTDCCCNYKLKDGICTACSPLYRQICNCHHLYANMLFIMGKVVLCNWGQFI